MVFRAEKSSPRNVSNCNFLFCLSYMIILRLCGFLAGLWPLFSFCIAFRVRIPLCTTAAETARIPRKIFWNPGLN